MCLERIQIPPQNMLIILDPIVHMIEGFGRSLNEHENPHFGNE